MKTYVVTCTIAEDRNVVVEAKNAKDARDKIARGKYKRLGRPTQRGFLVIGEPREEEAS